MDKTLKIVENSKKNDFAYSTIFWWDQEFGESDQAQCQIKWKYTKFSSNCPNWLFLDKLSHLGGQIKPKVRPMIPTGNVISEGGEI